MKGWLAILFLCLLVIGPVEADLKVPTNLAQVDDHWLATVFSRSGELCFINPKTGIVRTRKISGTHCADVIALGESRLAVLHRQPTPFLISEYRFISESVDIVLIRQHKPTNLKQPREPFRYLAISNRGDLFAAARADFEIEFFETSKKYTPTPKTNSSRPISFLAGNTNKLATTNPLRNELRLIRPKPYSEIIQPVAFQNITSISPYSETTLVVAGQRISRLARTSFDDIHWGSLVQHELRKVSVDLLQKKLADGAILGTEKMALGKTGEANADPHSFIFGKQTTYVSLAGANQVLCISKGSKHLISVEDRPTSILLSKDEKTLYAVNSLSDSLSVIQLESKQVVKTIQLRSKLQLTQADRGERLFFNAKLSHDGWMSCHTCHFEGGTHEQLVDTLGDGGYSNPKKIPSLFGVSDTAPYAWTGLKVDLETQIRDTLSGTMHFPGEVSDEMTASLIAYLKTLQLPTKKLNTDSDGFKLFESLNCTQCHKAPFFTTKKSYDVGIHDEIGISKFNPPSLRGLSKRRYFFHDNRANGLASVFTQHKHQLGDLTLTDKEVENLVKFLNGL